jgi:hypothetical protein
LKNESRKASLRLGKASNSAKEWTGDDQKTEPEGGI